MNISIGEKKVFGGAAPCQELLKDYRRPRDVTGPLCTTTTDGQGREGVWTSSAPPQGFLYAVKSSTPSI